MSRCTSELLESYLQDYGWTFRREGAGLWRTAFQVDGREFPLAIIMTDNVISFVIQPFIAQTIDWDRWPEVSRLVLELNARSTLAKFAIGVDGRMELSIEVLNGAFDYDSFALTMGLLGYYAEIYHDEILEGLDLLGYSYAEPLQLPT